MREGGQRTQPLGIRREARLSPSQTCSITSSSVSRARCGNGFARSSSPSMFHWVPFWAVTLRCLSAAQKRLVASTAVRLLKRAEPAGARRGKPRGFWRAHSSGLSQKSMPPCWSRRIVAQYLCGHRARRLMRTDPAVSPGSNWTRYEQPDAAHTAGTLIEASHPCRAAGRGPSRRRHGTLAAGKRVLGPPVARAATAVVGAHIPRACARGRACPGTPSSACEVFTRGCLTRLQATTSAALATDNQTI